MSLLDDARQMVRGNLLDHWEPDADHVCCPFCGGIIGAVFGSPFPVETHADDCPWLSMPKIVKALEAAERDAAWIKAAVMDNRDVCEPCRSEIARAVGWDT